MNRLVIACVIVWVIAIVLFWIARRGERNEDEGQDKR